MALLPYLGVARGLTNLLLADAQCHAYDPDKTIFVRDLTDALKLGSLLTQRSILIEDLVGSAIQRAATKAAFAALGSEGIFPPADARALLAAMDAVPAIGKLDLTGERLALLDLCCYVSVFGFAHTPLASGTYLQPEFAPAMALVVPIHINAAMRDINHLYDQLDSSLRLPTYRQRITGVQRFESQLHSGIIALITWSTGMNIVMSSQSPSDTPLMVQTCQSYQSALTRRDLTRVALALLDYKLAHREYPEALAALAAPGGLLKEVPNDGFADAPLKYRREGAGYVLYSVGKDEKDDGGDEKKDQVVRMKS